jgi:hypothetical protein
MCERPERIGLVGDVAFEWSRTHLVSLVSIGTGVGRWSWLA